MERSTAATSNVATTLTHGCVIDEEWHGRSVVLSVSGVLDMLTASQLEAGLTAALGKSPVAIIIDLTDVDFLASAGMGALVTARDLAGDDVRFAVVASGPATSRPLTLVGLAYLLGLHPNMVEARAALGV